MDDIVKRIRQQSYFGLEPYEAADEIEQLRQRVQELEEDNMWQARKRSDVITERDALRQRVAELERFHELDTKQIAYLFEERNLLTAERDDLLEAHRIGCEDLVERHNRIAELRQQRDELMAVVEMAYKVASQHDDRLPFDWAVYCEMLYQAIASVKEKA